MKYIITLSILIIIVVAFNSCNDSLGIEKNVLITTIDTNSPDTTGKDTIQKIPASIDSIKFEEQFLYDDTPTPLPIDEIVIFQEAFVDTSTYPVYVWLKIDLRNQNSDELYQAYGRTKYTQSVRFTVDSLLGEGEYNLIGKPNSGYWSELVVRNIETKDSTIINGSDSKFKLEFRFDYKKHITAIIYADIPNPNDHGNVTHVKGEMILKYPK